MRFEQCAVHVVEFLARDALAQILEDARGRLHAHVGGDEARLEVVQYLGIDLAADGSSSLISVVSHAGPTFNLARSRLKKPRTPGFSASFVIGTQSLTEDPAQRA
jgi:hypothetical protein